MRVRKEVRSLKCYLVNYDIVRCDALPLQAGLDL